MKRKSMKKGLLRAAVVLSLLGGAMPAQVEAYYPAVRFAEDGYTECHFNSTFTWDPYPLFVNTTPFYNDDPPSIKICLDNGFLAANNVSKGTVQIAYIQGVKKYEKILIGSSDWQLVDKDSAKFSGIAKDMSQNGVELSSLREHDISTDFYDRGTGIIVYYTIKEAQQSYLNFENEGMTWENGQTILSLRSRHDLGETVDVNLDSLRIKNPEIVKAGDTMTLLNDGGKYDAKTFENKLSSALNSTTDLEYTTNPTKSITTSGVLGMGLATGRSDNKNTLNLVAKTHTLENVDIDLSRIGSSGDAWTPGETLYKNTNIALSASTTITASNSPESGTTDENFKVGTTMTLLDLSGSRFISSGLDSGAIITKYGDETISGSRELSVNFSDTSTGGVNLTGTHTDTLSVVRWNSGFLGSNYHYMLNYTIGNKNITGVGSSEDGIDLSNKTGGFVVNADDGYCFDKDYTLDLSTLTFTNSAKAGNYTLLDLTNATGNGKLSVKAETGDTASTSATIQSDECKLVQNNSVTAYGVKDIVFNVTEDGKKVDVSNGDTHVSKIKLDKFDVEATVTIGNLVSEGTFDDSNFSMGSNECFTFQKAADLYGKTLTLLEAEGDNNFSNWTGLTTGEEKGYKIYEGTYRGTTAILAGTLKKTDKSINMEVNGLKSIVFGMP